jgi:hypothetical protein
MILGDLASEADVKPVQRAEAAAHSIIHIVPVYEVGERDGGPISACNSSRNNIGSPFNDGPPSPGRRLLVPICRASRRSPPQRAASRFGNRRTF